MRSNNRFDCVVIGDIFIDINVRINTDRIIRGGIVECKEFICTPAGVSNVAVALSKLGCKVALVGKCGYDMFGDIFLKDIRRHKIRGYVIREYSNTGMLISLVDPLDRSFITARGANNNLSMDEVDKILSKIQYRYLYTAGYSLSHEPQSSAILHAMEIAKKNLATIIFDAGSYNIINDNHEYFEKALRLTDILSCNLEEAKSLTSTNDLNDAISSLRKMVSIAIIRLGSEGCIVCSKDIKHVLAPKVNVVDTTGAGDAFTSAFIYGLIKGWDLYKASYFANLFASNKITKMGARAFPSKREIRSMLKEIESVVYHG